MAGQTLMHRESIPYAYGIKRLCIGNWMLMHKGLLVPMKKVPKSMHDDARIQRRQGKRGKGSFES